MFMNRWPLSVLSFLVTFSMTFLVTAFAFAVVPTPPAPSDPGGDQALYEFTTDSFQVSGRQVDLWKPVGSGPFPAVVYGHGQALGIESYRLTFEHLARKGVVVIFPQYDSGFFDQNWERMAGDYRDLVAAALAKMPGLVNSQQLVYSGHSKGAYIALKAAGRSGAGPRPASLLLFQPADFTPSDLNALDKKMPVTLVWADQDRIISEQKLQDLYRGLPSERKQLLTAVTYQATQPALKADHFFVLTKGSAFGGVTGVNALHRHGAWKWLVAAADDLRTGARADNRFLYGDEAVATGLSGLEHRRMRSWTRVSGQLETVPFVDLSRYAGRWYQQMRNPLPFEPLECPCAQQTLTPLTDGSVGVYNSCNRDDAAGPRVEIRGTAVSEDPQGNARFVVDFGLPRKGQYWIIGLDEQYRWAVVSDPSLRSLYILSKTPVLEDAELQRALAQAETQVPLSSLRPTLHSPACVYPN